MYSLSYAGRKYNGKLVPSPLKLFVMGELPPGQELRFWTSLTTMKASED
jgi:hypothetical protein